VLFSRGEAGPASLFHFVVVARIMVYSEFCCALILGCHGPGGRTEGMCRCHSRDSRPGRRTDRARVPATCPGEAANEAGSCASELVKGHASIYHVSRMLGHKSLDTLKHYVKLHIAPLKETHHRTHPRERDEEERGK